MLSKGEAGCWLDLLVFVSGDWEPVSLYFKSVAPLDMHTKLSTTLLFPFFFSLPFLWVTSMHHFRGRGGESQINKISFQSLCSQRELVGVGGCGRRIGGEGGSVASNWKLLPLPGEICVHYLQSQTNRSRAQVYMCVCATARKPPCLSSSITVLCCWSDRALSRSLSVHTFVCLQWCLCLYFCLCVLLCVHSYVSLPTCVPGLDPEKHLGKPLADMEPYLKQVIGWQILHHTFSLLSPGHYLMFISYFFIQQFIHFKIQCSIENLGLNWD